MLPPKNRLFRHFKTGGMLKVAARGKVMKFSLSGTGRMLSKLYRCATHYARNEPVGSDPFHSAGFTYD